MRYGDKITAGGQHYIFIKKFLFSNLLIAMDNQGNKIYIDSKYIQVDPGWI